MSDPAIYRESVRAAWLGLAVNLVLGLAKVAGGLASGSVALISDAVNSLGDVFISIITLFGLHVAQRPADAEHPYGHTRAEAIAASNVALLVVVSAIAIGWQAIVGRWRIHHEVAPTWTLWLAGINVVIKEGLYRYKSRVASRAGSTVMMANAWDHRSDALCSLAVLVGLAAVHWGGQSFLWADELAALVVVTAIVIAGIALFFTSASELMDVQAPSELVEQIRQTAGRVSGVRGVETLWVRKSGLEYFVDIHIEVDPNLSVAEGHRIGHVVKDRLLAEFAGLRNVLVHLEPFPRERPNEPAIRSLET
ncbi:MAG TPA: cation diffusion facilitator family transporter [Pirellulales bacterium]|nr:cation diffusion facilitator family transporter [Pirellulales bacterium]